jgi:O-antigen ligase
VKTPTRTRAVAPRGKNALPFETGLIISLVMLLALVMLAPVMTYDTGPLTGEGNMGRQLAYLATLGVAIYAVRPVESPARLLAVPWPLVLVLGYCALTLSWSLAPGIGARRLLLTAVVIWAICLIVMNLPYRRLITCIRVVLVITLIANYVTVLLFPDWGIHHSGDGFSKDLIGAWRGFMIQKNYAGAVCAITFVIFAFDNEGMPKWLPPITMIAATGFLFMSASKTSFGIGVYAVVGGLVYMLQSPRYRMLFVPVLFVAGFAGLVFVSIFKRPLSAQFDDPQGFTGRVQIWQATVGYWRDHVMTGTGYGSFWNIGPTSPVYSYGRGYVLDMTSGHSGFLDLLATIGLPGLIVVIFAAVLYPLGKLLADTRMSRQKGALLTALVLFCIGHNSTETSLFERDQIVQVFLMFAIAMIARSSATEARAERASADKLWSDLGMGRART